jgi:transcriptional accessory protein Tex/SPT6
LGGFARVEQLLEAGGMDSLRVDSLLADSVLNSFYLDTIQVDQIDVNTASVRGLMRLPYLRFEQAQAIYELRRRKIRLDSIEQLQSIECLSYETLQNIAPYLKFNKK